MVWYSSCTWMAAMELLNSPTVLWLMRNRVLSVNKVGLVPSSIA